jgi:hypothetical protein
MTDLHQELMTPPEAAKWFRRSTSWLRHQPDLLRVRGAGGQPLYHVSICRAYVLGRICGLTGQPLHRLQIKALAAACGLLGLKRFASTALRSLRRLPPGDERRTPEPTAYRANRTL